VVGGGGGGGDGAVGGLRDIFFFLSLRAGDVWKNNRHKATATAPSARPKPENIFANMRVGRRDDGRGKKLNGSLRSTDTRRKKKKKRSDPACLFSTTP
jgi:hypothetical protein